MKKILIAPNSYKECASSDFASNLFQKYLSRNPELEFISIPISDGGDGFLEVCKSNFSLDILSYKIKNVYSDEYYSVDVGISNDQKSVFIESAKVIGLQMIPVTDRKPLILTTSNLGELIVHVKNNLTKAEKIIIGIGGTGTNDLGMGFCKIFGLKAFDSDWREVNIMPKNYYKISHLKWDKPKLNFEFEIIIDVDNPLLGEAGATKVFGLQKGANNKEIELLEEGFTNLIKVIKNDNEFKLPNSLSGAGGGLAAGLQIFFNATIKESKTFINEVLFKKQSTIKPDYIITGEGSFDSQSLLNKGAKVVVDRFIETKIPVFLVCGKIDKETLNGLNNIIPIELTKYFKDENESIKNFDTAIKLACNEILTYLTA